MQSDSVYVVRNVMAIRGLTVTAKLPYISEWRELLLYGELVLLSRETAICVESN